MEQIIIDELPSPFPEINEIYLKETNATRKIRILLRFAEMGTAFIACVLASKKISLNKNKIKELLIGRQAYFDFKADFGTWVNIIGEYAGNYKTVCEKLRIERNNDAHGGLLSDVSEEALVNMLERDCNKLCKKIQSLCSTIEIDYQNQKIYDIKEGKLYKLIPFIKRETDESGKVLIYLLSKYIHQPQLDHSEIKWVTFSAYDKSDRISHTCALNMFDQAVHSLVKNIMK